ncbi:MAG: hypothetical protein ACNFW9_05030 [Candidatus Kerfeldbacteria bacterium]
MAKREMCCFLIYKIEKRYRRSIARVYKVEGQHATIHATSKTAALKILKGLFPGLKFKVVVNQKCCPTKIVQGDHCFNNLIAKDPSDFTLLGFIQLNSPEWIRRVQDSSKPISDNRQKIINDMHKKRPDLYD